MREFMRITRTVVGEDIPNRKRMHMDMASGTFVVHSAPRAVVNHIEWAVNGLIGAPQRFRWREFPDQPGLVKLSFSWEANPSQEKESLTSPG